MTTSLSKKLFEPSPAFNSYYLHKKFEVVSLHTSVVVRED